MIYVYICVPGCTYTTYMQVPVEARRDRSPPLELSLQAVVSCLMWVLGTKPGFSAKAVSAISRRAISPAPAQQLLSDKKDDSSLLGHFGVSEVTQEGKHFTEWWQDRP